MNENECVPLTPYVLRRLRTLGPYTLLIYVECVKWAPDWNEPFAIRNADIVEATTMSYKTVRKALSVLSELGLVETCGRGYNQYSDGMMMVVYRKGCRSDCSGSPCAQPVDNLVKLPVDNSPPVSLSDFGVASNATADSARARKKAQVKHGKEPTLWSEMPQQNILGGGIVIDIPVLTLKGKGLGKGRKKPAVIDDPRILEVFEAWNLAGVVQHKAMLPKCEKAIIKALETIDNGSEDTSETLPDIRAAIVNYATCYLGAEYAWSYRWTLEEFLNRGLSRFLDEAKPLERERELAANCRSRERHKSPTDLREAAAQGERRYDHKAKCKTCGDTKQVPDHDDPKGEAWADCPDCVKKTKK